MEIFYLKKVKHIKSCKLKLILFGIIVTFFGYLASSFLNFENLGKHLNYKDIDLDPQIKFENGKFPTLEIRKPRIKRYLAFSDDRYYQPRVVKCSSDLEVEITNLDEKYDDADIVFYLSSVPLERPRPSRKSPNYVMVYEMESEVHSSGGVTWSNADFRMWYNLNLSFPEPATYFDVKTYLVDLLSPPKVEFENKLANASTVWVISNCGAYNARERFVDQLMSLINVHSYGSCLPNKFNHPSEKMKDNVKLFANYKFVLAIENSNCVDYVSEKLIHAVASGSIPIVAGRNNKPNYLKFMPNNSYINIYDFKTVDDLAVYLEELASNKSEYEKFISFKRKHGFSKDSLLTMSLANLIRLAGNVFGYVKEKAFFDGIILKEKSENKICKVARYLWTTPPDRIIKEIEQHKINKPSTSASCLKKHNLVKDFNLKPSIFKNFKF